MHFSSPPCNSRSRRVWSACARSLGKAICDAVDAGRTRIAHVVEASRTFETAAPSPHVIAAAIVGAAPGAIPDLPGVVLGPAVKLASQTLIAVIAAHASARIFAREGHRVSFTTLLGDAIAHGGATRRAPTPQLAGRFLAGRLRAGAIDLVPGLGDARRVFEAAEGALLAARFVALAERHALSCITARATRLHAQEPVNDNDATVESAREWALA
jgi:hypothetical protein